MYNVGKGVCIMSNKENLSTKICWGILTIFIPLGFAWSIMASNDYSRGSVLLGVAMGFASFALFLTPSKKK